MADERGSHDADDEVDPSARASNFFADRPSLRRGIDPYEKVGLPSAQPSGLYSGVYPAPPTEQVISRERSHDPTQTSPTQTSPQTPSDSLAKRRGWSRLLPWNKPQAAPSTTPQTQSAPSETQPFHPGGPYIGGPHIEDGLPEASTVPDVPILYRPRFWEKQPYSACLHLLALGGTATTAWFFGILVAQILPGNFTQPPLQEALLRKSSRVASQLWHFPQLWRSPTAETRIEAIPLPETGPVLTAIDLPPIERQPLIDELNAIETEILTLDRRLQTLEKQLGSPPYQGAGIDSRLNALRAAIDPPVRPSLTPQYEPVAENPNDSLLAVAKLKITLPSDALFAPGQSDLKDAALLNQVLDQLVNYPNSTVLIRSHSDNQAGAKASRDYTLAQANALSNYLRAALRSEYRWVTLGSGQSQPIADNGDVVERQRNRRIEILVDTR